MRLEEAGCVASMSNLKHGETDHKIVGQPKDKEWDSLI